MFTRVRVYLLLILAGSVALLIVHAPDADLRAYLWPFVVLTVASFFAQIYELEILPHHALSTHMAISLASLFIGGLPFALWVAVASTVPAEIILRRGALEKGPGRYVDVLVFNVGQILLCLAAASAVLDLFTAGDPLSAHAYLAMSVSFVVYTIANLFLVAIIISLTSDERFFSVMRIGSKRLPLQFMTMGVLAILMYTLYQDSPYSLGLVFVPIALVHYSVQGYLKLGRESHLAFKKITDLLEQRDQYTGDHSDEVEELAAQLGTVLGMADEELDALRAGAAIHDIGKIAIPDSILHKRGGLTSEEYETMKTHTTIGAQIIQDLSIYRHVIPIVLHEHEHWNGGGYPHGLAGEAIPLSARVVAVADVYSALTTKRAYRPPQGKPLQYTTAEAKAIMVDMAGTVLDPRLVEVFFRRVVTDS
ncbi:MAG: HD-GYP domain-containing protein [Spirochaetaceae bacterium]